MEKLNHLKNQINQLSEKLKASQVQTNLNQKQIEKIQKSDLEFKQVMDERNQLIDKVAKAESQINQLIQKIQQMQ